MANPYPFDQSPHAPDSGDHRQYAPAATRNREPILEVLRRHLPTRARVLELASGTGEHAVYFTRGLPDVHWQPSDPSPEARMSIASWVRHVAREEALLRIHPPLELDVHWEVWPVQEVECVVAINLIHISPWSALEGLLAGAARTLTPGGILYLYGPYRRNGMHTSQSNEAFDGSLRSKNPAWGVRDLEEVVEQAQARGFSHIETIQMPANNLSVVFRRA